MNLTDEIKDKLGTRMFKKLEGKGGGGCINEGEAYEVDDEKQVFVKRCKKDNAAEMMFGEFESLKALQDTNTVRVPKPLAVVSDPESWDHVLVMEYLDMSSLSKHQAKLGEALANLHLHNENVEKQYEYRANYLGQSANNDPVVYIDEFGFDAVTCCGALPMVNDWNSDWITFFSRNRLEAQFKLIAENYGDREANELWSQLQILIPRYFKAFAEEEIIIKPSLLHGDLWSGNAADLEERPVVFDPCCFYGHSEYDLAISEMFGGFHKKFYEHYSFVLKKVPGFEKRIELYQLFHYLNHWNHFGGGYKNQSINLLKKLVKI